ncbi:MAG: polysaccharide pyruvyl transferase family protein [Lachnospiraceae bacterium]|nr:polysaccharide pyruvyl transferase family protein [Lachnospiraceae bacterium]
MKYGLLLNKSNVNIGDDIQAYATARFLPTIDYFIDREHIDEFMPDEEEPVSVIMNAWYMWAKWNWPPSKYINPCFVGIHYADHQLARQPGSPIKFEFLTGLGGDYLRAYQPIGCRDHFTAEKFQELGIDSYFSGCITLTLPQMPAREDKGQYICLVDLEDRVTKKLKSLLEEKGIEVRIITHNRPRDCDLPWDERQKIVEELLTVYQNARCVITKRLHCSLPCLAMGVPVFVIKAMTDDIRFSPYYDFLHHCTVSEFMRDEYDYDFMNPPRNKDCYVSTREALIRTVEDFVRDSSASTKTVEELTRTSYTEEDVRQWRHDVMKKSMDQWLIEYRVVEKENHDLTKSVKKLTTQKKRLTRRVRNLENDVSVANAEIDRLNQKLINRIANLPRRVYHSVKRK